MNRPPDDEDDEKPALRTGSVARRFIRQLTANDTWRNGAENHPAAQEGDFLARRAAAIQAYHEWMPTRPPDTANPLRI